VAADQLIAIEQVDAVVLGMGQIGSSAYLRLKQVHGRKVLGVDNNPDKLAAHQAAGRRVIEGDAVDSDFWVKLVICASVKLVLLAMPGHAGNAYALQQLMNSAFAGRIAGRIAAIVSYPEEVKVLRELGAGAVFHVYDEAGAAFADDALAGRVQPGYGLQRAAAGLWPGAERTTASGQRVQRRACPL
jgi:glutathione-regulated potassium-efflux system ancillary protein KefC